MSQPSRPAISVSELLEAVEIELKAAVEELDRDAGGEMVEMIRYHLGWRDEPARKGKRLRPLLGLLSCQAAGGDWQQALPMACAIELIHNFTLIHDDIEDQSDTRRGRITIWKRWGIAQAINTGDAVLILAHLSCQRLRQSGVPAGTVLDVQRALDEACLRLTVGQYQDLAFEDRADISESTYLEMVEGKTAALIAAGTQSGALVAGADAAIVEAFREFGHHLGLAFQIQDDILGIWGSPEVTGKPAGDDLRSRKKTLPILYGMHTSGAFVSLWGTRDPGEAEIRGMTETLERIGGLSYAENMAQSHMEIALASLDAARPMQPAAAELRRLSISLLGRDR
jgi:geranylgeranyl diphosphate synthase type I